MSRTTWHTHTSGHMSRATWHTHTHTHTSRATWRTHTNTHTPRSTCKTIQSFQLHFRIPQSHTYITNYRHTHTTPWHMSPTTHQLHWSQAILSPKENFSLECSSFKSRQGDEPKHGRKKPLPGGREGFCDSYDTHHIVSLSHTHTHTLSHTQMRIMRTHTHTFSLSHAHTHTHMCMYDTHALTQRMCNTGFCDTHHIWCVSYHINHTNPPFLWYTSYNMIWYTSQYDVYDTHHIVYDTHTLTHRMCNTGFWVWYTQVCVIHMIHIRLHTHTHAHSTP